MKLLNLVPYLKDTIIKFIRVELKFHAAKRKQIFNIEVFLIFYSVGIRMIDVEVCQVKAI